MCFETFETSRYLFEREKERALFLTLSLSLSSTKWRNDIKEILDAPTKRLEKKRWSTINITPKNMEKKDILFHICLDYSNLHIDQNNYF